MVVTLSFWRTLISIPVNNEDKAGNQQSFASEGLARTIGQLPNTM